jgi:hypothetical protein
MIYFAIMGLEPLVALVLDFTAFRAYEDCSEITASSASDVMCLDGSQTEYGTNGTTIKGGLDEKRGRFFWVNFVTAVGTFVVESGVREIAREMREIRDWDKEEGKGRKRGNRGGEYSSDESEGEI